MGTLAVLKNALRNQEALILVMNDAVAKKVMVAWKIYGPTFADPEFKPRVELRAQLARLWEEVGPIDMDRLAEIAGVPATRAARAFARLKAAHLIWPDGSSSEEARRIVLGDVSAYIRPLVPKTPAPEKPVERGKTDGQRTLKEDKKADRRA
jgi:hypothetical protein